MNEARSICSVYLADNITKEDFPSRSSWCVAAVPLVTMGPLIHNWDHKLKARLAEPKLSLDAVRLLEFYGWHTRESTPLNVVVCRVCDCSLVIH